MANTGKTLAWTTPPALSSADRKGSPLPGDTATVTPEATFPKGNGLQTVGLPPPAFAKQRPMLHSLIGVVAEHGAGQVCITVR